MIIDVTNTIGRHKFKKEITAEELLAQMDENGIDIAVIKCHAESLDNESVYNAITKYPNRFIGLYTVNPWDDNAAAELEDALVNKGFKGLNMDPIRHGYMLCENKVFYPLLEVCRKHNAVVMIPGRAEVFAVPVFFHQICEDFPDLTIIMGKMGLFYDNASGVDVARRHKNVYVDTAGCMDFHVHRAIKTVGIDKVLMGTGTPDEGYYYFELMKIRGAAEKCDDPEAEAKLLYKNAARVFKLEEV